MDYLPINLKITKQKCLVVGGGNIALRKSKQLLKAGACLSVVSPTFHDEFKKMALKNELKLIESYYQPQHLKQQFLVIAATDNLEINQLVFNNAKKINILVNVVDQTELCQFIMPSVIDRTPLTIAISSGGTVPVLARMLREKIEWLLPNNIGTFLFKLKNERKNVSEKFPDIEHRRNFWEGYFEKLLKWSARENVASQTPRELDVKDATELNLDPELAINNKLTTNSNQLYIINITNEFKTIDDLTVNNIKALQKADNVYLTESYYIQFENVIRRDADIYIIKTELSHEDIEKIKDERLASQNNIQVVIVQAI